MVPPMSSLTTLLLVPAQVRVRLPFSTTRLESSRATGETTEGSGVEDGGGGNEAWSPPSKGPLTRRARGRSPNINWQAVSMEDLRMHPYYSELPPSLDLILEPHLDDHSSSSEVLQRFRQDSWQWDALHRGRLTTSKAASCLGFYERRAAQVLKVPKSLQGHSKAQNAWRELCESPCSLSAFAEEHRRQQQQQQQRQQQQQQHRQSKEQEQEQRYRRQNALWVPVTRATSSRATHDHRPGRTPHAPYGLDARRQYHSSVGSVRMAWGSAQEPTSLLNVLNVVSSLEDNPPTNDGAAASDSVRAAALLAMLGEEGEKGSRPTATATATVLHEAGLRMLELVEAPQEIAALWTCSNTEVLTNATAASSLLVGASPDGIIQFRNGSLTAVEVKNHAPFRTAWGRGESRGPPIFEVNDRGPMREIGAWHVAQLQLEMLCIGKECRSAIFASCSATRGLTLFRVERDDAYIQQMLAILRVFHDRYVSNAQGGGSSRPPPADFFSLDPPDLKDGACYGLREGDYDRFLSRTTAIAAGATVWRRVPEREMQRAGTASSPFHDQPSRAHEGATSTEKAKPAPSKTSKKKRQRQRQRQRKQQEAAAKGGQNSDGAAGPGPTPGSDAGAPRSGASGAGGGEGGGGKI